MPDAQGMSIPCCLDFKGKLLRHKQDGVPRKLCLSGRGMVLVAQKQSGYGCLSSAINPQGLTGALLMPSTRPVQQAAQRAAIVLIRVELPLFNPTEVDEAK